MEQFYLDDENSYQDEKIELQKYIRVLIRRWKLVFSVTILVTVPWVIYTLKQPPVYEAKAVIRFKSYEGKDPTLTESRTTVLTSRTFAEQVVAQMGLSMKIKSDAMKRLKRKEIFQHFSTTKDPVPGDYLLRLNNDATYSLFILLDDKRKRKIKEGLVNQILDSPLSANGFNLQISPNLLNVPQDIEFTILPFREAVKEFQSKTNVSWNRSGTLMTLTMTDEDPYLAAKMTNRLAEIFVEESASLKKKAVEKKRELLEEQVRLAKAKLDESERALKEFKEKYAINLDAEQQTQLNQMVAAEQEKENLVAYKKALKGLLARLDSETLSSSSDGNTQAQLNRRYIFRQIAGHPVFDNNATMLVYRAKLLDLEDQWKQVVDVSSAENPKAKEIDAEISLTHLQIKKLALQEIDDLNKQIARLESKINQLKFKLKQLPAQQQKLNELTRTNQVLEKQYTDLLAMYRDAQITEAVETEDIEILDPAIEPEFPKNLNKKIQAGLGGIFGLILGIGLAFLLEFLDKSIKNADEVKKFLKLTVLGSIPQIDFSDVYDFQDSEKLKQIDQQLVTHDYSPTPIGEAYRSLRTNILFSRERGQLQSMVITSNEPGDGKSFTAANLSITFAQLKSNTLLIDGDLRRGVLHNTFGVPKEPGFSNYLTSMIPIQHIIHETHIPNLSLITCGSLIPNPSELLASHQMKRFLDEMRRKFDLIIFDSPPLNAATDAVVVGTQVDATILVIRAGKTDRDLARQKLELFSNVPANIIGVVLNGTTADLAHPGYSYYHY